MRCALVLVMLAGCTADPDVVITVRRAAGGAVSPIAHFCESATDCVSGRDIIVFAGKGGDAESTIGIYFDSAKTSSFVRWQIQGCTEAQNEFCAVTELPRGAGGRTDFTANASCDGVVVSPNVTVTPCP